MPSFGDWAGGASLGLSSLDAALQQEAANKENRRRFDITSGQNADKIAQAEEIAKMREEVRQTIASLNDAGKTARANSAEQGRSTRWSTPSANVTFAQGALDKRSGAALTEKAREFDTPSGNVTAQQTGANYRHDTASGGVKANIAGAWDRAVLGAGEEERKTDAGFDLNAFSEANKNWRAANARQAPAWFGATTQPASSSQPPAPAPALTPAPVAPTPRPTVVPQAAGRGGRGPALSIAPDGRSLTGGGRGPSFSELFPILPKSPSSTARPGAAIPSPSAGPAAAAPASTSGGPQVGATVTLKNGQRVKITAVNTDGTFSYDPIRR